MSFQKIKRKYTRELHDSTNYYMIQQSTPYYNTDLMSVSLVQADEEKQEIFLSETFMWDIEDETKQQD